MVVFQVNSFCSPKDVTFGTYLTSLYNIDSDKGVFSADIWVWAKSDKSFAYKTDENVEISYLSSQSPVVIVGQSSEVMDKKTIYSQKKIQATFLNDFNLEHFPFDRQTLKIYFEDADLNNENLNFIVDPKSNYDHNISIDGWRILKVTTITDKKIYDTNFGNFLKPANDTYSRIALEITLARNAPFIFVKITLGLFAAVLIAMFSTFMESESDDQYSARLGLLGATLLAVVVNQQFADNKIGQTTTVTLVDSLHMVGFGTVFLLFLLAIISRKLHFRPIWGINYKLFDRASFFFSLIFFVSISAILLKSAIFS